MATAVLVAMLFAADPQPLTEDQAVAAAIERSRDLIAARLSVEAAQVDEAAAGVLPNPVLSYGLANLVVGQGNDQNHTVDPRFFDQPVQTVSVSQVLDVWFKRSKRVEAAEKGVEGAQFLVEQAVREVSWAVRTAFADALRANEEWLLTTEARGRYDETVRLSAARLKVGDISETDYEKIELEQLRFQALEAQAALQADLARQRLAALMSLPPSQVPQVLAPTAKDDARELDAAGLIERALQRRPDLKAALKTVERAQAALASQRREAWPDVALTLSYTHDDFTVSGDNSNTLALGVSLPLPLFDRNQAGVGHARVDLTNAENDRDRLELTIAHDVTDAVKRSVKARAQLRLLTDDVSPRASQALKVAEKSYQTGAISLLELLEAQRTYVEVREQQVDSTFQYRQAVIDLTHAVGGTLQ